MMDVLADEIEKRGLFKQKGKCLFILFVDYNTKWKYCSYKVKKMYDKNMTLTAWYNYLLLQGINDYVLFSLKTIIC